MRLLVSIDSWTARLLSVLAITPVMGCDVEVTDGGPGGGSGSTTTSSSASGGGTGSGGSTGTGSSEAFDFFCDDPEPVVIAGQNTGYVRCAGGWLHRAEVVACPSPLPRAESCEDPLGGEGNCKSDADCTDQPNGYCATSTGGEVLPGCFCHYGCTTDADCGAGQICLCGDPVGQCVISSCTSDDDCGRLLCSSYVLNPGCDGIGFACQTPADECAVDADCPGDEQCSLEGLRHTCTEPLCVIGRPFLVDGVERTAGTAARGDWRAPAAALPGSPRQDVLSDTQRAALAAHWTRAALLEHASIAAFARFALQLLSLGAPPELVAAAQAAMGDETEHARLCFALASAFAGRDVGPGPLSIDGALGGADPRAILVTAVREGCIGETVAAIEAAEAALHATDPAVRSALEKIAEDETRHAELAFRFAAWMIDRDPALAGVVADELAAAAQRAPAAPDAPDDDRGDAAGTLGFGVLSPRQRREIRERALAQVVAPCARALLARAPLPGDLRGPRSAAGGDAPRPGAPQRDEIESFATKS
ncbi:ferritin-like domain-containing protein [Sorangium sp. So ce131]|uniref:ferritin-like domain-containing protein n=1 Tax=Sorangium sp. So ce131 TaxID=3133282 RepID=UPI003F60461C